MEYTSTDEQLGVAILGAIVLVESLRGSDYDPRDILGVALDKPGWEVIAGRKPWPEEFDMAEDATEADEYPERQRFTLTKVYVVYRSESEINRGEPAFVFTDKTYAELSRKEQGFYGSQGAMDEHAAILDHRTGDCYLVGSPLKIDVGPKTIEQLREETLAKLTPTEQEFLGLVPGPE